MWADAFEYLHIVHVEEGGLHAEFRVYFSPNKKQEGSDDWLG
jgi:hypothetical protein